MRLNTEIKNGLADAVVREQNDLVVDTKFMRTLGDTLAIIATRTLDCGRSGVIQHCNYFEQAQTIQFLREGLLDRWRHVIRTKRVSFKPVPSRCWFPRVSRDATARHKEAFVL